jgi:hypothetical protein
VVEVVVEGSFVKLMTPIEGELDTEGLLFGAVGGPEEAIDGTNGESVGKSAIAEFNDAVKFIGYSKK